MTGGAQIPLRRAIARLSGSRPCGPDSTPGGPAVPGCAGWGARAARILRIGCLGGLVSLAAVAQAPLAIPLDADGRPAPPPGVELEQVGVIETLAGTGWEDFSGDGGPAARASLRFPRAVAADAAGNVYVADPRDRRIRKVDPNRMIATLAGIGRCCFGGDGGPASEARLDHPESVAVDGEGNVYVADSGSHRIRRIDAEGVITTFAGTGERGFGGDGGPATEALFDAPAGVAVDRAGQVYVADSWNHRVRRIDRGGTITTLAGTGRWGYGGDGGPAARARLAYPASVAVDAAGNVYVADSWNHRVRRIDSSGVISTLAGTGEQGDGGDGGPAAAATLAFPAAVASDPTGNVYVIAYSYETFNQRVRRISRSGSISAFAGSGQEGYGGDGGPAIEARLAYPTGVAADAAGNVYVADGRNARVRAIASGWQLSVPLGSSGESVALVVDVEAGGVLTLDGEPVVPGARVEAGTGSWYALSAAPGGGVAADYVTQRQQVRVGGGAVTLTRQEDGSWWSGGERAENGYRYAVGGREYVLELLEGEWDLAEYVIEAIAGGNTAVSEGVVATAATVERPRDVAVDAAGNVYVVEAARPRVRKIDTSGVITTFAGTGEWGSGGDGGLAAEAQLHWPTALAFDAEGNLYVAEEQGHRIRRIDRSGVITTIAGIGGCCDSGNGGPALEARITLRGLAADGMGNLLIADGWDNVRKIDSSGIIRAIAGTGERGFGGDGGPARQALVNRPIGIAADQQGYVYVADHDNHRVRVIGPYGRITTVAGTGERGFDGDGGPATRAQLNRPSAVDLDGAGNLYVSDSGNRRVRRIDRSGVITTVAGNGDRCCGGDGGPASEASLNVPAGIAVDGAGNVYVATESGNRVRKIDASGTITTLAGNGGPDSRNPGGIALNVLLDNPAGVATLPSGDMVFSDVNRVWRVDAAGMVVPFAGSGDWGHEGDGGLAVEARMYWLGPLASDAAGNVYVADRYNYRIRKIDPNGLISTWAGTGEEGYSGDGGAATGAQLEWTCELVADAVGNVYVAARNSYRIRKIDTAGRISTIAGTGERGTTGDGGPAARAQLRDPCRGIAADDRGNVYVSSGDRIRKIDDSGTIVLVKSLSSWNIGSEVLAVDQAGNLFIGGRGRVLKMDSDGVVSEIDGARERGFGGDGLPARSGGLYPNQLAVDRAGDILVAEGRSRRVRVVRKQRN